MVLNFKKKSQYYSRSFSAVRFNTLKSSDSAQLPHFNRQPKKYDYRSYYDSDDFSVVEELYTDDVVIFEYKEERRRLLEFLTSQE